MLHDGDVVIQLLWYYLVLMWLSSCVVLPGGDVVI